MEEKNKHLIDTKIKVNVPITVFMVISLTCVVHTVLYTRDNHVHCKDEQ